MSFSKEDHSSTRFGDISLVKSVMGSCRAVLCRAAHTKIFPLNHGKKLASPAALVRSLINNVQINLSKAFSKEAKRHKIP